MKKRLFFVLLIVCAFGTSSFSQTYTALQLHKERMANGQAFESKYFGKTITVQGKIWRISPTTTAMAGFKNHHQVAITGTGYESFIVCQIPFEQKELVGKLSTGQEITVTGTYNERLLDYVVLNDCKFGTTATEGANPQATKETSSSSGNISLSSQENQSQETKDTQTASKDIPVSTNNSKPQETAGATGVPEDIPFGTYRVHQRGMFQYKFTLGSYSNYEMNGKTGTVEYDRSTKTIRFTSGALKGFVGLYRPVNPTNEKDPPTIVIDFMGNVPVLNRVNDPYQYGYWQE